MSPIPHVTPEVLAGEVASPPPTAMAIAGGMLQRMLGLALRVVVLGPLWPLYLVLRLFLPRPPNVASAGFHALALRWVLFDQPPAPGLTTLQRATLILNLFSAWLEVAFYGLAWYLDDLLYGAALRKVRIVAPIYELSAARSGSTQLGHYLEADPHVVAPSTLQIGLPYIWMWRLARRTVGRVVTHDQVRAWLRARLPADFLERHEFDPFHTDTFEVVFGMTHLLGITGRVSPERAIDVMGPGQVGPHAHELWEDDFIRYIEAVGRKTLLDAAPGPDGQPRRLMIKGHFLNVADRLEALHPDACFLTVLRAPEKRLQSLINHHHAQPFHDLAGPPPWAWLVALTLHTEPIYNDVEMDWFQRPGPATRCVVRFDRYVADLEGTMHKVYRACMGTDTLPPHVPRTHAQRERSRYTVDRSLDQLGVDRAALKARSAAWIRWHDSID